MASNLNHFSVLQKLLVNERLRTPGYEPLYTLPGKWGMIGKGNLDLKARPIVPNGKNVSTVRTISVTDNQGRAYLLPTVVNGELVSPESAIAHWRQTGQQLGVFANEAQANRYSVALHNQQAKFYGA